MKTSKGEEKLIKIFKAHHISFEREFSFKGLTGKKGQLLRFDFALFNRNEQLVALCEFDGKQHFDYTPYFHKSINDFKRQQEWDRRKNSFCLLKKIPLIRIPYWDLDNLTLEKVLTNQAYQVKNKYHNDYLKRWRDQNGF